MRSLDVRRLDDRVIPGKCVVELKSGERIEADRITEVPQKVRESGARWPDDVKVKGRHEVTTHHKSRES